MSDDVAGAAAARLEDLRAITDAALGRLDVDDLLVELLDRVRQIIDADTAAVLLLDAPTEELVARFAQGLEEEVERGVRVPVGTGFAGRIALMKQPVLLDRVDSTTVANPILWEKGIRVMLGVPLLTEDELVGVLHVGRLADRSFTDHDAELLQVVAERVTGAILGRQAAVEQAAAHLLERSLLPERLPDLPGLEFAAHYVSPEDRMVGGDWYDTFTLPGGEVWIVTADVAGHGLHAAVVVGRVRSVLRAYALEGGSPAEVLERVDRKVLHFEVGSMITMVCAKLEPPFKEVEFTLAGHPPPVIVDPTHPARFLGDRLPDPPLGVLPGIKRHPQRVSFPEGSVLFTYTDGLVERRGEAIDVGLDRLLHAVSSNHPEQVCQSVMRAMFQQPSEDDVALMAIRSV
jgi:sigma-B regulation protein RsbU (phosphoserine phosphatase)